MKTPHLIPFTAVCSIGQNKVVAHAVIDTRNTSVHLHLYGEMFGNKRMPIQVKNSNLEFRDGKETDLVTQVLSDHFDSESFKIDKIEKTNGEDEFTMPGIPVRIIVRANDNK